jgi:hypothetical protein
MEYVNYLFHQYRIPTPIVELIVLVVSLIWLWTLLGWLGGKEEDG